MYKCLKTDFSTLKKKINAICKKLNKYNLHYVFEILSEKIEEIQHYKIDTLTQTTYKSGKFAHEVVMYNFEMQSLKLGNWKPIAYLQHGENGKNIVYLLQENTIVNTLWAELPPICEHCNSKRKRNSTVILQDTNGNEKQVGTSCIKEFTGIDGIDIINAYRDIPQALTEEVSFYETSENKGRNFANVINYLCASDNLISKAGYSKIDTKFQAFEIALNTEFSEAEKAKAQNIIEAFEKIESLEYSLKTFKSDGMFFWNIAQALQQKYSKANGFIAYAPIACKKMLDVLQKELETAIIKQKSQHIGTVGEKVKLNLKYIKSFTFENSYDGGYNCQTQYIHVFEDCNNNMVKWSTAKPIKVKSGESLNLQGTIKKHSEYKGEKQTEITRCKF